MGGMSAEGTSKDGPLAKGAEIDGGTEGDILKDGQLVEGAATDTNPT